MFLNMAWVLYALRVAKPLLNVLNPTIKIQPGDVAVLPFCIDKSQKNRVGRFLWQMIIFSSQGTGMI